MEKNPENNVWRRPKWTELLLFLGIFSAGLTLRVIPLGTIPGEGFDERTYVQYVGKVAERGLLKYREFFKRYLITPKVVPPKAAGPPPTRVFYIFWCYVSGRLFGLQPLEVLHLISRAFSVAGLALSGLFAWRLGGRVYGTAVLAMMALAPMQLYLSQRALMDSFFAFWALFSLWTLWEALQRPEKRLWALTYGLSLTFLVLTKENALSIILAFAGVIACAGRFQFGKASRELILATIGGPVLGLVVLTLIAGGIHPLFETYRLAFVQFQQPYSVEAQDGPWFTYICDLLLLSPLVLMLCLGNILSMQKHRREEVFLIAFLLLTFLLMASVKYSANLRYSVIWDLPLRFLAVAQIARAAHTWLNAHRNILIVAAVCCISLLDLRQYYIVFVKHEVYDPVAAELLHALDIIKVRPVR